MIASLSGRKAHPQTNVDAKLIDAQGKLIDALFDQVAFLKNRIKELEAKDDRTNETNSTSKAG